jgi:hypothetical protein
MCGELQLKPEPWTLQQILTAAIAATVMGISAVGMIISLVSLSRTRKLQHQQMRLDAKQEELLDRQLAALSRESTVASPAEKADVRVDLEPYGSNHRFVITNWGRVPARNVTLDLDLKEGRVSPLANDYEDKIPIPELAPGGRCSLSAALTFGTGTTFQARWTWYNPDGTQDHKSSQLAI